MINYFQGKYRFLSNFYKYPITYEGITYPSSEHAYQAAKTLSQSDREAIAKLSSPGDAKRTGRRLQMRPDWESEKYKIMLTILESKFSLGSLLAKLLCETYPKELVEGNNWHDNIWGNCSCVKCRYIEGQNLLGKALMQIRIKLLRKED